VNSYIQKSDVGMAVPEVLATATPNPVTSNSTLRYRLEEDANVQIAVTDAMGKRVQVLADKRQPAGTYTIEWQSQKLARGTYFITISKDGSVKQTIRMVKQ
jgi:flagellar hook assembly protein FlgD